MWREHFAPLWLTYFGGASMAGVFVLMAVAQVIDLSALMLVLPLVAVLHLAYRAALDRANERLDHLARIASYVTALRATADGVLIIGRDRHTTFMNAAAEWLTGWTELEAIAADGRADDCGGAAAGLTRDPPADLTPRPRRGGRGRPPGRPSIGARWC
jgi:PAS domain-containing protein